MPLESAAGVSIPTTDTKYRPLFHHKRIKIIEINNDIIRQICQHVDYYDLPTLAILSKRWKRIVQPILYQQVNFLIPCPNPGWGRQIKPTDEIYAGAVREQLHCFSRTLSSSPQLGQHVRKFSYRPLLRFGLKMFDTFQRIMYTLKSLEKFSLHLDGGQGMLTENDAHRYRSLFNILSFGDMLIAAGYPDCIMYVPQRPLNLLILQGSGRIRDVSIVNSQVDLSSYHISAEVLLVFNFEEDYASGLGSTFYTLSEMLAGCVRPPRSLGIRVCPISIGRFHYLLEKIGSDITSLTFAPDFASPSSAVEPSSYIISLRSLYQDSSGPDWSTVLPNLVFFNTNFIVQPMISIRTLQHLTIVLDDIFSPNFMSDLTLALSQEASWPHLRFISFMNGDPANLILLPMRTDDTSIQEKVEFCSSLQRHLVIFQKAIHKRNIVLQPPEITQRLSTLLNAVLISLGEHSWTVDFPGSGLAASDVPIS